MKRLRDIRIVLFGLLLGVAVSLQAQQVTVEAKMDSVQILIGHQTKIRLQVCCDAGQKVIFPVLKDTLVSRVELLEKPHLDTVMLNDNKRMQLTETLLITSFDSALYYLPPFKVIVGNKPYLSKALSLKVLSVPVDAKHPEKFFPLREQMKPDFMWEDWYVVIACSFLVILLSAIGIYLVIRLRDNKPIIHVLKQKPKLPADQLALQEIERIKQEKVWEQNREKEYYTQLTNTLREYIKDRFGFNAMEMTSNEIVEHLTHTAETQEALNELKSLLQTADLVKFAKWKPEINENDYNLVCAIEFVNGTKPAETEKVQAPVEIKTVIEKRSKAVRMSLSVGVGAVAVVVISLVALLIYQLYELLF